MNDAAALLSQLVAIDSVNSDLVPGGAGEGAIAQLVADWLRQAGLEVTLEEAALGRPNVIAVARGSGGGHSLMLNAHMDTVGVSGMERPHEPVIVENRLYGRGAYDMKGGLTACMLAIRAASRAGLAGDVILTAVADEEYASIGTQAIVRKWYADAAIVTEPTELRVCVAHKGFAWLDVETIGNAAHGSRPDLGIDAIAKMGKLLVGLEDLDRALRAGSPHPLLGTGSLHTSLISGGQELSSYPERCLLQVERRTLPGESPMAVEGQIQAVIDEVKAADADVRATVRTTLVRDPFEVSEQEHIVRIVREQAAVRLGHAPATIGAPFWMDAALLSAAHIPTVVFGPGGAGAHAVVEWADLRQLDDCTEILKSVLNSFCA